MLNRRPGGSLRWMRLSIPHFVTNGSPNTLGVPKAPSAGRWLSLPHFVSDFSDLQLTDFLSSPSYIIVQSPTQSLWNGMFVRHQAEITVMHSTGFSLPVHQSMSVPWDFYLVPYFSQPTYAISSHNCHRNMSLPSGESLWNGIFGRVEGQCTTLSLITWNHITVCKQMIINA